jgi:hypothetical protein
MFREFGPLVTVGRPEEILPRGSGDWLGGSQRNEQKDEPAQRRRSGRQPRAQEGLAELGPAKPTRLGGSASGSLMSP